MRRGVLIDTGPLVALLNRQDHHHAWAKHQFSQIEPPLLTCEAVLTEACFLLRQRQGGPQSVLDVLQRGVITLTFSLQNEAISIQRLLMRYANVPMALADACMVRLAELNPGSSLLTIDSDFRIYRMNGRTVIPILIPDEV